MRRIDPKVPYTLGLTLLAAITAAQPAAAQQQVDETRDAPADGSVRVANTAGSVEVIGWDRDQVNVEGTLGRGTDGLTFRRDGRTTVIRVEIPENARDVEASHLTVRVPAASSLDVEGVSADIAVDGVRGSLELRSVSGDVTVAAQGNPVHARSVSGDVIVTGSVDRLRASTASGDVRARGVTGPVDARSISGTVEVEDSRLMDASLESTSGTVRYTGDFASGAIVRFQSVSGSIELLLPADVSADFEVGTLSGNIENDFGPEPRRESRRGPGMELTFSTGDGDARVMAESFSGSVRIRRR